MTSTAPTPGFASPAAALSLGGLAYGTSGTPLDGNWARAIQSYGDTSFSANSVGAMEFLTNETVGHSYVIYPYADKTHQMIQEGMLVFVSRHTDVRYKLYNMAPVFKMNALQREAYLEFKGSSAPDAVRFKDFLARYGEQALDDYHHAVKNGLGGAEQLKDFYNLARKPEFTYLTKFGILNNWNFGGCVYSKGESTNGGTYLDHHSMTEITYVVGLACAQRARTSNIWGKLCPGDKVYLMLTREDADSPFIWVPFVNYRPSFKSSTYKDASNRTCNAHVVYVGLVTESVEREPTQLHIDRAILKDGRNTKDGFDAYAVLQFVMLQIRI